MVNPVPVPFPQTTHLLANSDTPLPFKQYEGIMLNIICRKSLFKW